MTLVGIAIAAVVLALFIGGVVTAIRWALEDWRSHKARNRGARRCGYVCPPQDPLAEYRRRMADAMPSDRASISDAGHRAIADALVERIDRELADRVLFGDPPPPPP